MINYDLVEKIGATHYDTRGSEFGFTLYTFAGSELFYNMGGSWCRSTIDKASIEKYIKPIPPWPQVRIEYEHIEKLEVWDLKEMFDNGELYSKQSDGQYVQYINSMVMINDYLDYGVFRRVEKVVDWQKSLLDFLYTQPAGKTPIDEQLASELSCMPWKYTSTEDLKEMCRIVLRATGEL